MLPFLRNVSFVPSFAPPEHKLTRKTEFSRSGGSESGVVGLHSASCDEGVAPVRDGIAHEELKLTQLVSSSAEANQIVPFHVEPDMLRIV